MSNFNNWINSNPKDPDNPTTKDVLILTLILITILTLSSCKVQPLFSALHETKYLITDSTMKTQSSENRKVRFELKGKTLILTHVGTSNSLGYVDLFRIRSVSLGDSALFTKYLTRDSICILIWPGSHATVQYPVRGSTSRLEFYDVIPYYGNGKLTLQHY